MTEPHDWRADELARIPDDVLNGRRRKQLARWLEQTGYRPTLLEITQERARRKANR